MALIVFADNFNVGAVLTLVMPVAVLIAIACWYSIDARRIPGPDHSEASATPGSVDPIPPAPPVPPAAPGSSA